MCRCPQCVRQRLSSFFCSFAARGIFRVGEGRVGDDVRGEQAGFDFAALRGGVGASGGSGVAAVVPLFRVVEQAVATPCRRAGRRSASA